MTAGISLCVLIALVSYALASVMPIVGGPVFAIIIGMLIALPRSLPTRFQPGIRFAAKSVLQLSIVLLGATLQLEAIVRSGMRALPVMLGSAVITLTAAYLVGRLLGIDRDLRRLLGIGTTICGASAIAALAGVIAVSETEVAYAISTVFFFNIAAVLTFPWIGHILGLSQYAFGLWAGTAINDTSSVVAAGYVFGHAAGNEAVIAKLTRTTLIIPIVLFYAGKRIWAARKRSGAAERATILPLFIVWFVVAATLNSFGLIPPRAHAALIDVALFLIIVALAAVGLSANARAIRQAGPRPLALGFILWAIIAASSLTIAHLTHLA
jgi:uncharacterized integral membrane protein (TIGR00698 family)